MNTVTEIIHCVNSETVPFSMYLNSHVPLYTLCLNLVFICLILYTECLRKPNTNMTVIDEDRLRTFVCFYIT